MLVIPFENSLNTIGGWMSDARENFRDKQDLIDANEELQAAVDTLTEQNNILIQDQAELARLEQLYDLDEEYTDYPKIAARIISKDPVTGMIPLLLTEEATTVFVWIIMLSPGRAWWESLRRSDPPGQPCAPSLTTAVTSAP